MKIIKNIGTACTACVVAGLVIMLSALAHCQQVTPAYSSARVEALAQAIGRAEGYYVKGSKPNRLNNPGDLKELGQYRRFRTPGAGWEALRGQLVRVVEGRSQAYTLHMTLEQFGRRYASDPAWPQHVAKLLKVSASTRLENILCEGFLDVPPQIRF